MIKYNSLLAVVLVGFVACIKDYGTVQEILRSKYSVENIRKLKNNRHEPDEKFVRLGTFGWKNCGTPSQEVLVVTSLSLQPDPIQVPGTLLINFTGIVNKTIDSPLQVSLKLEKNVFGEWLKIPCIGNIGSCTYSDLCSILSPVTCPSTFIQQQVPCKCPFKSGVYSLTNGAVDINIFDEVPVGDYRATANLTTGGQFVGCYFMSFSLAD